MTNSNETVSNLDILELRERDIPKASITESTNAITNSSNLQNVNQLEMQRLNVRFTSYLKRLGELETTNQRLKKQCVTLRSSLSDGSDFVQRYEPNLAAFRAQLDGITHECTSAEIRESLSQYNTERFRAKIHACEDRANRDDSLRQQLEYELVNVKDEYSYVHSQVFATQQAIEKLKGEERSLEQKIDKLLVNRDEEIIGRRRLQDEIQTLNESLVFKRAVYETELLGIAESLRRREQDSAVFYRHEYDRALAELRIEFKNLHEQQTASLKSVYNQKHAALLSSSDVVPKPKNVDALPEALTIARAELKSVSTMNIELATQLDHVRETFDTINIQHQQTITEQTNQIDALRTQVEVISLQRDDVSNMKTSLELEILTYRRLLDSVESTASRATTKLSSSKAVAPSTSESTKKSSTSGQKRKIDDGEATSSSVKVAKKI